MDEDLSLQALREENRRLRHAVDELSVLNELAREIGSSHSPRHIVETVIRSALAAVEAEQGVLTLAECGQGECAHTLVREGGATQERPHYHCYDSLVGWMQHHKEPLHLDDPHRDERFLGTSWEPSIRTLLAVPLMVRSEVQAILTVYNKADGTDFTGTDKRLLAIIAAQSAQVLETARLREQETSLLRVEEQLSVAAGIQAHLLPTEAPTVEGYEIAGLSRAAQAVGGDYFDFIPVDDHRLVVCLGDVSGKGVPASLLMANLQATIRGQALVDCAAATCVRRSNRLLYRNTESNKFVTFFYGLLDHGRHELAFCNAGQNPPLLLADDPEPTRLFGGGLILGLREEAEYRELSVSLGPGDLVAIYSDGVTEAVDEHDEEFGEQRLVDLLGRHRCEGAGELVEHILEAVAAHSKGVPQTDDITAVIVKRRSVS